MTDDKLENNGTQEYTGEAQRHAQKISENYRKLLDKATAPERYAEETPEDNYDAIVYDGPALTEAPERAEGYPEGYAESYEDYAAPSVGEVYGGEQLTADNAARISEYTAHPAPKTKKVLFEGVTYTKGGYMHGPADMPVYTAPSDTVTVAPEAPVREEVAAPVEEMQAPIADMAAEDSIPTPRTMLHRTMAEDADLTGMRVGFWEALSVKMRVAIAAVATAVFIAIAIICINTAVLGNLNADIAGKQMRLTELRRSAGELQEQIDTTTDPANVDQWATEHGMVR